MLRRIIVGDTERVMLIREKRFERILGPGAHWIFGLPGEIELERHNTKVAWLTSDWTDFIVNQRPDIAAQHFVVVDTGDSQVAVVSYDGKLVHVIAPAKRVLYWRAAVAVTFELIDVRQEPEVPERLVASLSRLTSQTAATFTNVEEGKRALVYIDGRLVRELGAGKYGFWSVLAAPRIDVLDVRRQTVEVTGQEILTQDKVTLRVNIAAVYEIVNVVAARTGVKDVNEHLHRTLQIAVRQTLGKRTLEQVLADKTDIDEAVSADVRREMELYGVRVGAIALKDIILPGDIRDILNQVVTAEKQAQANLIRRREETAATRSLLNTARLMEENPLLVRMKELEALEKIADKVDKITVVGGFNTLLDKTVTLRPE